MEKNKLLNHKGSVCYRKTDGAFLIFERGVSRQMVQNKVE